VSTKTFGDLHAAALGNELEWCSGGIFGCFARSLADSYSKVAAAVTSSVVNCGPRVAWLAARKCAASLARAERLIGNGARRQGVQIKYSLALSQS